MGNAPFWQLAILQSIGPLNTVLIGTLAIGLWASRITAQTQQRREYQQFRHDLIVEMAETASALHLATQRYWRARIVIMQPRTSYKRCAPGSTSVITKSAFTAKPWKRGSGWRFGFGTQNGTGTLLWIYCR